MVASGEVLLVLPKVVVDDAAKDILEMMSSVRVASNRDLSEFQ